MPNFYELVPQDRRTLIDEITRRAEQYLVSSEEANARFGVKMGREHKELERIKVWLAYRVQIETEARPNDKDGPNPTALAIL